MKALVYEGPGQKSWKDVPNPSIQDPRDAIVKIDTTTICGTDLHILKGDVPAVQPGRILGHEGVGTVTETGSGVTSFKVGDQVILSCVSADGSCSFCKEGLYSHCTGDEGQSGIGWIFGHLIDGTQAEYVRVPYADTSMYRLPESVSQEHGVLLSDIFPTGFEIGVQYGQVQPGDVVAVIGAGPVGLAVMATAGLYGAAKIVAVDLDANRVEQARRFGATHGVNSGEANWREQIMDLTDGWGVDVAVEAVGIPATFEMCTKIVRPGGKVANVGVHGKPVTLELDRLWIENINISTGLVNTNTLSMLLKLIAEGKLPADEFISHRYPLQDILQAYDTFSRAAETGALKVILSA